MTNRGIRKQLKRAQENVDAEIKAYSQRGGKYASGLSSEGYAGGYRQCLSDVLLALNGVNPNSRYWKVEGKNDL